MSKVTPAGSETDLDLIRRARKGDEQAFTMLVRRYEEVVYSFAFKVCRDRLKATETVQDTFINVFLKLRQFDGRSKFSTWLYSIVTNNCLMKHRRTKLEASLVSIQEEGPGDDETPVAQLPDRAATPADRVLSVELKEVMDQAIQKLPMEYRVVFVLSDIEDVKVKDIARILKLSLPAVKSRLRRARIALKNQLQPYIKTAS